jgi:hypothetical protein
MKPWMCRGRAAGGATSKVCRDLAAVVHSYRGRVKGSGNGRATLGEQDDEDGGVLQGYLMLDRAAASSWPLANRSMNRVDALATFSLVLAAGQQMNMVDALPTFSGQRRT